MRVQWARLCAPFRRTFRCAAATSHELPRPAGINVHAGGRCAAESEPKERAMKLSAARVERTLSQIDAQAIPEDHPVIPQLNDLFGDHTFFIDSNGLNIVEPAEPTTAEDLSGQVINLASWSDLNPTSLEPHDPEPTDVVVKLGPEQPRTVH
jgi:hypothetical protein